MNLEKLLSLVLDCTSIVCMMQSSVLLNSVSECSLLVPSTLCCSTSFYVVSFLFWCQITIDCTTRKVSVTSISYTSASVHPWNDSIYLDDNFCHILTNYCKSLQYCAPCGLGSCRISPPRFLAECGRSPLNQGSFVVLYFVLFNFSGLYLVSVACHLSF